MAKVAVVTPCFNCARYIGEAVASVQNQEFRDWEHVVVDDGSTDASAAVVEALVPTDDRLRLIRLANGGVARARNAGVAALRDRAPYLLFLDADDVLRPGMLAKLVAYLDSYPEVGLAYCQHEYINAAGAPINLGQESPAWPRRYVSSFFGVRELARSVPRTPFESILGGAGIAPSMSLIRRSAYDETPGWDENFGHVHEDADLFLQIALRSEVHFIPEVLVAYRRHDSQATKDPEREARQAEKLHAKWRNPAGLSVAQQAVVMRAWRFVNGRLVPWRGLRAGNTHFRRGELGKALRFYAGAVRRYVLGSLCSPPVNAR